MTLQVTVLYAGLMGLILVGLGISVALKRRKHRVGIGDGDNHDLKRGIRVHGNAAENVPYAVLLLAICEFRGLSTMWLHIFGVAMVVGRLLHISGLTRSPGTTFGRFYGVVIS